MAKFLIHDWFVRQTTNTKGKFLTWTAKQFLCTPEQSNPGGALGYFLGGYVPPGTPNWYPVLKKNSPKIDTPF